MRALSQRISQSEDNALSHRGQEAAGGEHSELRSQLRQPGSGRRVKRYWSRTRLIAALGNADRRYIS